MKQSLIISATVVLLFILQSLPAYRLTDFHLSLSFIRLQVDIACIFSIYLGVREKYLLRGALLALVVGLFANSFAPTSMRIYAFLAPACFVVTYMSNAGFYFKRLEANMLLIFVISLLYNWVFFYLMRLSTNWQTSATQLLLPTVLQALMNALFGALLFTFFDWIMEAYESAHQKRFRY